ncbi:MAG: hypothetical protein IJ048_00730 [Clostridia bacterium]|nr:hypothetical protein [Clostridia bacterium]
MSKTRLFNFICAALMLILLVLQFTPFWRYGDPEQTASIQGYVWMPSDHSALEKQLQADLDDSSFTVEHILAMPILVMILCAVGIVFCLIKSENAFISLLPAFAGLIGAWGYAAGAAFHQGGNWGLHLALCIIIFALGAISVAGGVRERKGGAV